MLKQDVAGTVPKLRDKGKPSWKLLQVEWLGQMVASLCWTVSIFVYGINSAGDWLQLLAASAWLIANLAALFAVEPI